MSKKDIRRAFRDATFKRDGYRCRVCGRQWAPGDADPALKRINAHHITDRNLMPNGGYVPENGITVCEGECHMKCERKDVGWEPERLYLLIGSNYQRAVKCSEVLE